MTSNGFIFVARLGLFALALAIVNVAPAAETSALRVVATVPLPTVAGRFDHFTCDVTGKRLFIAALGNNTVEVIDVEKHSRLHSIRNLRKPTGVLYLAEAGRVYVANGDDGTFRVFDGKTFAPIARLASVEDADNVRFDAEAQRIYVGFGDGALGVTDQTAAKLFNRIDLPAHPESFQRERTGVRIFVNLPDAMAIAVVDRNRGAVVERWPMEKFQANFPMALDKSKHRLFVGCRRPARLVVFDTNAQGTPIADLEISGDTDDLFFDAKRQRIYVSCGEGFVDVIQCRDGNRFERIERIPTRAGARTSFFSGEMDRLYVAVPQRGGQDAEIRVYQPN
jgi:DNA-binding beta-propeller fold protein YncE